MDVYRSIVITIGTLWSAVWGAVVVIVDFILNVHIGFLVSIAALLACAVLLGSVYSALMAGLRIKYNIAPYSRNDSILVFINFPVYIGLVFTVGYFIEYISKVFKVI
jgi:hypothetical protein